jgi:hypothetical protein
MDKNFDHRSSRRGCEVDDTATGSMPACAVQAATFAAKVCVAADAPQNWDVRRQNQANMP